MSIVWVDRPMRNKFSAFVGGVVSAGFNLLTFRVFALLNPIPHTSSIKNLRCTEGQHPIAIGSENAEFKGFC